MPSKLSRMFTRPRIHSSLIARPYDARNICVLSAAHSAHASRLTGSRCTGNTHTHFTRAKVAELVARGEMRWLDYAGNTSLRQTNTAAYTEVAASTWQKTPSGPVATMQMKVGEKGRYVPVRQREEALVLV